MTKAPTLTRRWNLDGSISLLSGGRVVFRHQDLNALKAYAKGWFGDCPERWGRSIFTKAAGEEFPAELAA
jgi:hypothetical protein